MRRLDGRGEVYVYKVLHVLQITFVPGVDALTSKGRMSSSFSTYERIMQTDDIPRGWVKPVRPRTINEVKALILARQRELAVLELELFNLQQGPRLEALAQARNIMRAHQLTVEDICKT